MSQAFYIHFSFNIIVLTVLGIGMTVSEHRSFSAFKGNKNKTNSLSVFITNYGLGTWHTFAIYVHKTLGIGIISIRS